MRFRPETWRPWLEPHGSGHVLDAVREHASGQGQERRISRDDLAAIRERAGDDPDALRDLFVAVMIWGSGTTNGRGPRYTDAALSDSRLETVLRTTRESVREGDLSAAYGADLAHAPPRRPASA
ncbi:hypothetical protein [Streptomyces brevispora]|uniref:8-oxoguanine DNA glycosylase OGG fold protein n=1 Tax=Streptomyces brevispora TaxID=887462 RepID=UPI002DDB8953|nr:hypothetical protein [Streptomyces brevispora]